MVGIVPSNWLFLKEIVVMSVMTPNPPGRVPSSLFPSRLRVPIGAFNQSGGKGITIRFVRKENVRESHWKLIGKKAERSIVSSFAMQEFWSRLTQSLQMGQCPWNCPSKLVIGKNQLVQSKELVKYVWNFPTKLVVGQVQGLEIHEIR